MSKKSKSDSPKPNSISEPRQIVSIPPQSAAVARCRAARQRAYNFVLDCAGADEDGRVCDWEADEAGNQAYREAMPTLDSFASIGGFICCVTHGMLTGVFDDRQPAILLYAASIALRLFQLGPQTPSEAG